MRAHYIRQAPTWKVIAATAISSIGALVILGVNLWESGYEQGMKAGSGANNCAPIVVYRRGAPYSTEELRRMIRYRERAV